MVVDFAAESLGNGSRSEAQDTMVMCRPIGDKMKFLKWKLWELLQGTRARLLLLLYNSTCLSLAISTKG